MNKTSHTISVKEAKELLEILRKGRNRYDNRLMEVEKIWARLKPNDYQARKKITDLVPELLDLDRYLKEWEDKLRL